MPKIRVLIILLLFVASISCGREKRENVTASSESTDTTPRSLPLPEVPSGLQNPAERADYILKHFWDEMDFSNREMVADTALIEQSFANFLSLVPYASAFGVEEAVDSLIHHASVNKFAFERINDIADFYLREPNSPMRNERLYILFAEKFISTGKLDNVSKEALEISIRLASLNMEGSVVNDLPFISSEGKKRNLRDVGNGKPLLIFFYDPDCETCNAYEEQFSKDKGIEELIRHNDIAFLALCMEGEKSRWREKIKNLPHYWQHGYVEEEDRDADFFYLPALPSLYLIDSKNKVMFKDRDIEEITDVLTQFAKN